MRAEASAITLSGLDHRLSIPPAADEFRRLALTLNDMLGRLETATISERRFLDDASHQLRTPLAVLCAELELAARRPRSHEELLAAVQDAYDEATRLAAMADQLLTNARRTGRLAIARQPTHLSLLLRDAALTFSNRAARIGIRITVDASDAVVYLDARRVRQALDNLIDNALRHGRTATAIHLRGRVDADWVCIVIEDDGVGFSARPLDEDGTDDRHGLGLPYVTATVAAHGGTIAIDNNPAGGARLTMRLPTLPQDADSDLAAHPGPAGGKVASS
jgi:signal transduction histidine kinase